MEQIELTKAESQEMELRNTILNTKQNEITLLRNEMDAYCTKVLAKHGKKGGAWSLQNGFLIQTQAPEPEPAKVVKLHTKKAKRTNH